MNLDLFAFLVRTLVVSLAAMGALAAFRRASASTQHALAASALLACLVLAPASLVLPRRIAPLYTMPISPILLRNPIPQAFSTSIGSVALPPPIRTLIPMRPSQPALPDLGEIWVAVTAVLLLRLAYGLAQVAIRVGRSERLDFGPAVNVRLDRSARSPMAVWWGRRMILLPPGWNEWPAERLDHVLKHETAHLDRGDCWTQIGASLACALVWPNPLLWWLKSRTRRLAEQAVDDAVLRAGVPREQYAQDLLDLAVSRREAAQDYGFSMATRFDIERRIVRIMDLKHHRLPVTRVAVLCLAASFAGLTLSLSAWDSLHPGSRRP